MSTLFGKRRKRNKSLDLIQGTDERKEQQPKIDAKEEENDDVQQQQQQQEQQQQSVDNTTTSSNGNEITNNNNNNNTRRKNDNNGDNDDYQQYNIQYHRTFQTLGLVEPLRQICGTLGYTKPTPIQRVVIPYLVQNTNSHIVAVAETGSGKTASFVLPILHHCSYDPYGVYAVILAPTRELAKQIHQQIIAFGRSTYNIQSTLIIGGFDCTYQATSLDNIVPHFIVATPGRLGELLRGPKPPRIQHIRYLVFDEADRLLAANSGFTKDIAEIISHTKSNNRRKTSICQTLFFTATLSKSLQTIEQLLSVSSSDDKDDSATTIIPLKKFIITDNTVAYPISKQEKDNNNNNTKKKRKTAGTSDDNEDGDDDQGDDIDEEEDETDNDKNNIMTLPKIPTGLKQEYIFMPSRVRDAYLLAIIRTLVVNGGRLKAPSTTPDNDTKDKNKKYKKSTKRQEKEYIKQLDSKAGTSENNTSLALRDIEGDDIDSGTATTSSSMPLARSVIIFVGTCERAAMVSGILEQVGVPNVALHSLLSQNRRLAALGKFVSEHVRVLVATDVASRGLDIPTVDLVVNSELPRNCAHYVHRVGRTARAGRRGRAISLVGESDIILVQKCESISGRILEKCNDITDDIALQFLGPTTKAARVTKMKLLDIGFDELVTKMKLRKLQERQERIRREKQLQKFIKKTKTIKQQQQKTKA